MSKKKKALFWIGPALIALLVISAIQMDGVSFARSFMGWLKLKPEISFEESTIPEKPNYSLMENWAAHPGKQDAADVVPFGSYSDNQKKAPADVFYIHPTTYYDTHHWNQPQGDRVAERILDEWALKNQASAFNECCRVYAPRYRQATVFAFMDLEGEGKKAMELAYSDIKRAFAYYLAHQNQGRPLMISAHSQGAYHGFQLLHDFANDEQLVQNLIVAYIIGMPLKKDQLMSQSNLKMCETPEQTGCLIAWNTIDKNAAEWVSYHLNDSVCINPLTWKADEIYADFSQNLGSVRFNQQNSISPKPDKAMSDAVCQNGILRVSTPKFAKYLEEPLPLGKGSYHVYDFSLFYLNIRQNASDRLNAYMNRSP